MFCEFVLWICELGFDLLLIYLVNTYEARTQHQRCRTHVRHGDAQGTPLPARPATLCHVDSMCFSPTRADASRRGSDTGRFARNRADSGLNRPYRPKQPIQTEIQKKKKKAERTIWLNTNPTSAQFDCLVDCLIDYLLFSFNFELVSCILISKHYGMF